MRYAPFNFSTTCGKESGKPKIAWQTPCFSLVEKKHAFQHFRESHLCFQLSRARIFFLDSVPNFIFASSHLRFHKITHIFSFSTEHLFKIFHRLPAARFYPQNRKSFPFPFPLAKARFGHRENPAPICLFQTFPTFLHHLKLLLLKK